MNRTFLLPVVSATSLAVIGCSGSIDGDWSAREVTYDGSTLTLPAYASETYDGGVYTSSYSIDMSVDADGTMVLDCRAPNRSSPFGWPPVHDEGVVLRRSRGKPRSLLAPSPRRGLAGHPRSDHASYLFGALGARTRSPTSRTRS